VAPRVGLEPTTCGLTVRTKPFLQIATDLKSSLFHRTGWYLFAHVSLSCYHCCLHSAYTGELMPKLNRKLTDTIARFANVPSDRYVIYWCAHTPGFGVRVTPDGARSWILERRVNGRTVRRTLGHVTGSGRGAVTAEKARELAVQRSGELVQGRDVSVEQRAERKSAKRTGITFAEALRIYVEDDSARKRPLKARTRSDYFGMILDSQQGQNGRKRAEGELASIANKRLNALTGVSIKSLYKALQKRGQTRAAYAMRVLRGTLNYHGVRLEDDPFDRATPRRERIVLPSPNKRDRVVPAEKLASWWKASSTAANGDFFQLLLLTGLRRGELTDARVADIELQGGRLKVPDTKSRKAHVVLLSEEAMEIVRKRVGEKSPYDLLFEAAGDPRKSLRKIVKASGVAFSAHDCRRTFGTIAASLLPGYLVKRLLNHADGADVTAGHYIHLDEQTLRAGWQTVADFVMLRAKPPRA
jgi:integrase